MEEKEEVVIPATSEQPVVDETPKNETTTQEEPKVKTFTQDEVNDIVSKRLEKEKGKSLTNGIKEVCTKYGVNTIEELDEIVNKSKDYDNIYNANKNAQKELLFLKNDIDNSRYDDVLTYFNGKDLELNEDNLKKVVETHPEWIKKIATVKQLGNDKREIKQEEDVKTILKEYWGL